MATLQELDQIRSLLEEHVDDVTDREVQLFTFLHETWAYIPNNLMKISGPDEGKYVANIINDWVFDTYELRFHLSEETMARKRKKEPR